MPNYFNPASMLIQGGIDPKSPFAGALAGIQGAYAMRAGDDAQTMNQLSIMENLEKLNQEIADREMYDTERTKKITTNKYDTEDITSGRRLDRDIVKVDTEKENLKGKKQDNEIKQRQEQENFMVQLAEEIKTNDFNPYDGRWNERRDEGKKLGLNLPPFLENKDKMFIINKAKSIVNNAGQQRRMAEITHTGEENLRTNVLPTIAGRASTEESMAGINHGYRMKEIQEQNKGKSEVAEIRTQVPKNLEALAVEALRKGDMKYVDLIVQQLINLETKSDPLLVVDAERRKQRENEIRANIISQAGTTQPPQTKPTTPTQTKFTQAQEAAIAQAMKDNEGATREQIIEAARAAGKL